MYRPKHRKARRKVTKAGSIPLVFLFLFLGAAVSSFFFFGFFEGFRGASFLSAPIAFAASVPQEPILNSFPVALDVPIIPVKTPIKVVHQAAVMVASKPIPKKMEAYLKIPKINVNAVIKDMGVTPDGVMAVPDNSVAVGWFSLGTRPGEVGSAVVGGHNRWDNVAGAFADLHQLIKGDVLSVVDAKGVTTSFVVRETRTYVAVDFDNSIFLSAGGVHLNLITCSGVWDPATKSYTTRLVVFTDGVNASHDVETAKIALH